VSADYFLEIEAHFAARRGTPFVVSPKDWALMKKWSEDGVPLPVVIEAIDSCFDKQDAKGKKINGLSYCRHAVKELWDERRELQIGGEGVVEESPAPRLEGLAEALASGANEIIRDVAPRVRELARERSVPRIEEALMELEAALVLALLPLAPELRVEAERLVAGADEKTRARSLEAHVRRLVRERFGIPRLTLF
jgi:hypothetical protein